MATFASTSPPVPQATSHITTTCAALKLSKKFSLENAIRSIFGWLLLRIFPQERGIEKHEWVEIYDSEEEEELHDNNSGSGYKLSS